MDFSKFTSLNIGGHELVSLKRVSDKKVIWQKVMEKLIKLLASNNQWQNYSYKDIKKAQGDTGSLSYRNISGNLEVVVPFLSNEFLSSSVKLSSNAISNVYELDIQDPNLTAINDYAFYNCNMLSVAYLSSIESIGQFAFFNDTNLTSLYAPQVSSIGAQAFVDTNIKVLDLPNLVQMQSRAFRNNKSLVEFNAPQLTNISDYGLNATENMSSIYIPSIKTVTGEGLSYCKNLISIDFNEIQSISYGCMRNDWKLENIKVADDNDRFYLISSDGVTKCKNGYIFIDDVNKGTIWASELCCPSYVVIPQDITTIGGQSFYRSSAQYVYCPNVKRIEQAGFQYSSNLMTLDFSDKTDSTIPTLVAINALDHLNDFYQVKVPTSLYYDWREETNWCESNIQPHIAAEFTEMIGSDGNTYKFTHMDIAKGRQAMDGSVSFQKFSSTTENTIYEPFANITALSAISSVQSFSTIDPNLSTIGAHSFENCKNLSSAYCPYIKTIVGTTFSDCTNLKDVNCSSVVDIGSLTFNGCTNITHIECPNVLSIGSMAFYHCYNLSSIECSGATDIISRAFRQCTSLLSIDLPNVSAIGDSAFYSDLKLTYVNIPNISTIPSYCFYQCKKLSSIDVMNPSSIGNFAFFQCETLSDINLDNAISIGNQAFNYCTNLINGIVDMPYIDYIGTQAFGQCSHITKFDLYNISVIGDYAFQSCKRAEIFDFSGRTVDTIPQLQGVNAFFECGIRGTSGTYQILVPSSLYDDWIVATNWSEPSIVSAIVAV